jgi:MFS family permease
MTIGGIVYGIATGIQMPGSAQFLTETVDRESSTMALAVSNACISLGITLSPVIVNALAAMFGPIDGTTGMLAAAIGYGVLLVAEIVYELLSGKPRRAV